VYPIGEPTPESPVFVTTNFSLTYFIVAGEIENTGVSAHLLVCDTEGQLEKQLPSLLKTISWKKK